MSEAAHRTPLEKGRGRNGTFIQQHEGTTELLCGAFMFDNITNV